MTRIKSDNAAVANCPAGVVVRHRDGNSTHFDVIKPGASPSLKIRFGSVLVEAKAPSKSASKRNIEAGRVALGRVGRALARPGVKVELGRNVPLYRAEPSRPGYLIQTLRGTQKLGKIVDGKFKPV